MLKCKNLILFVSLVAVIVSMVLVSSCQQITATLSPAPTPSPIPTSTPTPTSRQEWTEANISQYRLTIDGLVNTPLTLTYESLMQYPAVTESVVLYCPGVFTEEGEMDRGVSINTSGRSGAQD